MKTGKKVRREILLLTKKQLYIYYIILFLQDLFLWESLTVYKIHFFISIYAKKSFIKDFLICELLLLPPVCVNWLTFSCMCG